MGDYDEYKLECFKADEWDKLTSEQKIEVLQELEYKMAEEQGRSVRKVIVEPIKSGAIAEFRLDKPSRIYIDPEYLESMSGYEAMEAVIHEGRHAYQYDVVNDIIDENKLDEETKEKKQAWKENSTPMTYRDGKSDNSYFADYRFQPVEDDAYEYTNEKMQELLEHVHGDRENCEEFLNQQKHEKERDVLHAQSVHGDNYKNIIHCEIHEEYNKITDMSKSLSEIRKLETKIEVLEKGRDTLAPERMKESLEKSIQFLREQKEEAYNSFRDKYNIEPEEAPEFVKKTSTNMSARDAPPDLKTSHISPEKQLNDLQKEYSPKQKEVQALKHRANQMEMRLKDIQDKEARIIELKSCRQNSQNTDSQIKQLENSRDKAHEFFKREYNVEPENAPKAIEKLRGQATTKEQELKPMEEKIKILKEQQRERRVEDSRNKENIAKEYSMSR